MQSKLTNFLTLGIVQNWNLKLHETVNVILGINLVFTQVSMPLIYITVIEWCFILCSRACTLNHSHFLCYNGILVNFVIVGVHLDTNILM